MLKLIALNSSKKSGVILYYKFENKSHNFGRKLVPKYAIPKS